MKTNKIVFDNDHNITKSFYLIEKIQVIKLTYNNTYYIMYLTFNLVWEKSKNRKRMQYNVY